MRINAGVSLGVIATVLRGKQEYVLDANLDAVQGNTETLIYRFCNRTDQIATWGVILVSNGHNLHSTVSWGGGLLTAGRPGQIQLDNSGVLMSASATGLQTNIRIFPDMWLEIRVPCTWANVAAEPAVTLVPEIAGIAVWAATKSLTGMPTTTVLPGP